MKAKLLSICLLALAGSTATAQDDFMMVNYQVGFPMGELQSYIEKTSWRGINIGYRHLIDGEIAVGVDLSTQVFYEQKDYDTYTRGTASLTGTQYRYSWNTPMTAHIDYVLGEGKDLRPFIGMGLGALYSYRVTDFGLYRITQDPWQFIMVPEVGVTYYMSAGSALFVSAKYNAAFDSKDMGGQSYIGLNVGVLFSTN
ncbi:MAG TPA: hypothetical protein PLB89_08170 [Flavobacteriales bacterium]|nr:hypothetical protein [Flavobacteriales bacterium]